MAKRLIYKGGAPQIIREFLVNDSQTIYAGDVVVLSGGKMSIAADAAAAGTVVGVSLTDIVTTTATATDLIKVDIGMGCIYNMAYDGTATPAVGTAYDLYTAAYVFDSDDSTGGYFKVVGNVDTTNERADVMIINRTFEGA